MSLLVRTWNVFHGNAEPPEREAFLEEMVRLATADSPGVLCLQEVPVWALARLGEWSTMTPIGAVASRPALGPLPIPAELGRRLTDLDHGLLRSAFTGQANAILLGPLLESREPASIVLNGRAFRAIQAKRLGLDAVIRLAWAKERRVCQAVRVTLPDGGTALVANLHASKSSDERLADAELLRAAVFVDALARPGEPVILAGDFNVIAAGSTTLAELGGPDWGFSGPGPGVDHVLVRGVASPTNTWPEDRRRLDSRLLSDHAPVEVTVG